MRPICSSDDWKEWHKARAGFVCASEMPLLFEDIDLFTERKFGPREPMHPKAEAKAEWGHRHEDCIAKKFGEVTGLSVVSNQVLCAHDTLPVAATLDFDVYGGTAPAILECKTAYASRAARFRKDELPQDVIIQIQTQLLVTERDLAYCAWLLDGWDFGFREVHRDETTIELITKLASAWHAKYIKEQHGS